MVDTNKQLIVHNSQSDYTTIFTVVKGLKDVQNQAPVKKRKNRKKNDFINWCMPEQPSGYIRSNKHDFL
jgi:hypothetical protein